MGRVVIAGVLVTAAAMPSAALAAKPSKHSYYRDTGPSGSPIFDFDTSNTGRYLTNILYRGNNCPLGVIPGMRIRVPISLTGKFSLVGKTYTDEDFGTMVTVTIVGRFISSRTATGTLRFDSPGCVGTTERFSATRRFRSTRAPLG